MNNGDRRHKTLRLWILRSAVAAYLGLLAFMSLRPVGDAAIDRAIRVAGHGYLHLPAYALLSLLWAAALGGSFRRVAGAAALATAYGWALEVAQLAAPSRHFNGLGLGLDLAGALGGCLIIVLMRAMRKRPRAGRGSGISPLR